MWTVKDNAFDVIAIGAMLLIIVFLFAMWWRIGRDPNDRQNDHHQSGRREAAADRSFETSIVFPRVCVLDGHQAPNLH